MRPILITGSIRSGSTWFGSVLGKCSQVRVVHEPMNPYIAATVYGFWIPTWFLNPDDWPEIDLKLLYDPIFRPPLVEFGAGRSLLDSLKRFIRLAIERKFASHLGKRVLIKDPIAIFASTWIAQNYDIDVIVLVRHPAAYCLSSIKDKKYVVRINDVVLRQKKLVSILGDETVRMAAECASKQESEGVGFNPIYESAVVWRCFYEFILARADDFNSWTICNYEEIACDPISKFMQIYADLDLPWESATENYIKKTAMQLKPDQTKLQRHIKHYDAKANSTAWITQLTSCQQDQIHGIVEPVFDKLYDSWT